METAPDTSELWSSIIAKIGWSLRPLDLPADRTNVTRETLLKLESLIEEFSGEEDPKLIENLIFGRHRSHRFVTARINSLYAFRHLSTKRTSSMPLAELNMAVSAMVPECDRNNAFDLSSPEFYEASLPLMETMMGIYRYNSDRMIHEFFVYSNSGAYSLMPELRTLVSQHPDKASLIPGLIRDRNFDRNDIPEIGALLGNVTAPLLEGSL